MNDPERQQATALQDAIARYTALSGVYKSRLIWYIAEVMPNNHLLQTSVITTTEELEALRPEWDELLGRARCAGIFQTWEWITTCRRHFGRRKKLLNVCVREEGRLVGIAPLQITSMYGLPFRRLQFIGTGVFDYMDFIIDPDLEQPVLQSISGWLDENRSMWDVADLQNFHAESPALSVDTFAAGSCSGEVLVGEECPYLPLAGTWEDMQGHFGKKMRTNLRYYERTARKDFEEVHLATLGLDELTEGMDAFFRLHTMRWKRRWLPGVLAGEKIQAFHREVARQCLKRGWLHLHGLRIDGKLQAVLYCFAFKERGYYYLGGFDPNLSKYSLGTVLTGFAIRRAIEEGCTEFDFLRGNEPYKSRWTKEQRKNSRMVIHKNTPRSKVAFKICLLEHHIEQKAKHELHKRIGAG